MRVSVKDKKDVSLYFDKETGLLAKMEYRGSDPGTGKEINEERIITEYEQEQGRHAAAEEDHREARRQAVPGGRSDRTDLAGEARRQRVQEVSGLRL